MVGVGPVEVERDPGVTGVEAGVVADLGVDRMAEARVEVVKEANRVAEMKEVASRVVRLVVVKALEKVVRVVVAVLALVMVAEGMAEEVRGEGLA
eukprot:5766191-Prymnesium_polylepis.1